MMRRGGGVLGRSRTEAGRHSLRSHPRFGQHATLPASLPRLILDALSGQVPGD
jgi:hypothetical protein